MPSIHTHTMSKEKPRDDSLQMDLTNCSFTSPEKDGSAVKTSHQNSTTESRIPHSDSGIVVTPLTPAGQKSPAEFDATTVSPSSPKSLSKMTVTPESPRPSMTSDGTIAPHSPRVSPIQRSPSKSPVPCLQHMNGAGDVQTTKKRGSDKSPRKSLTAVSRLSSPRVANHRWGSGLGDGNVSSTATSSSSPRQEVHKTSRSPRPHMHHSKCKNSPDSFAYETKYVVLHFLQHATNEKNLKDMCHSQTSLSTTSESEPPFKGLMHTQKLRARWQDNRSSSLPTSPEKHSRPLAKTKGNRSSPDLKDANFFKDVSPQSPFNMGRPLSGQFAHKFNTPHQHKVAKSGVLRSRKEKFVRSISDYTETSENGTYNSDADDELDTSFDSSHHGGSVTSHSLRERVSNIRASRLPTVHSEAESMADYAGSVSESTSTEDSQGFAVRQAGVEEAISLDMIQIEDTPLSPLETFNRVHHYLAEMNEHSLEPLPCGLFEQPGDIAFAADDTLFADYDEVDSPPLDKTLMPNPDPFETGEFQPTATELVEGAENHPGFFQSSGSDEGNETEEGAHGGEDKDDCGANEAADDEVDDEGACAPKADRSKLCLDFPNEAALLVDAVHSLRQEVEDEMSSFESEYEEAMQSIQLDGSLSCGLGRSHLVSPETAEAARILARIGDEVQQRYFQQFELAVSRLLLANCTGLFTYENFREAAMFIMDDHMDGWIRVATLLLYSQHVALHLAQSGRRGVHRIVDYTVKLLAEKAANFIITQGGWAAISSIGQTSSSSPEDSGPVLNPFLSSSGSEVHSTGVDPIHLGDLPLNVPTLNLPVKIPILMPHPTSLDLQIDGESSLTANQVEEQGQAGGDVVDAPRSESVSEIVPPEDLSGGGVITPGDASAAAAPGDVIEVVPHGDVIGVAPGDATPPVSAGAAFAWSGNVAPVDTSGESTTGNTSTVVAPTDASQASIPEGAAGVAGTQSDPTGPSGNGNVLSNVHNVVTNSSLFTRCAVSVGLVAVGAAVLFNINRS